MSRKDYEAIALALHAEMLTHPVTSPCRSAVVGAARAMCHYLSVENPRFNAARFIVAVETGVVIK